MEETQKTTCSCCNKELSGEAVKDGEGTCYCSERCQKHVEAGHAAAPNVCEFC